MSFSWLKCLLNFWGNLSLSNKSVWTETHHLSNLEQKAFELVDSWHRNTLSSASISATFNLRCTTTYSVSVPNRIPKRARSMPAWPLWPWNHISTSHPHGKQKSKYNPKLKRGAWRMEDARALPQKIKSQSHEWTDAEGGHGSVCTPWRRSSAISQQRGRAKEGEKFLKHFWSSYWLCEYS